MASVHIGRLMGPVGFARTVAIKRLHAQYAEDPQFVAMFLDEARLAARIRHPNVVPTLDVITVESELFVVMEYIQGESLFNLTRALCELGQPVPPDIAVSIMAGVLHGLHAAHEACDDHGAPLGIVHRDVSPQNVLVGIDGVPRMLDFGVAKAAGRLQTTRDGQLKGKLSYMAPEQVRSEPVTRRTDVYAASAVLWELLTGTRLFGGGTDAEVLSRVLWEPIEPPSTRTAVPLALDTIVLRGLERDPEARFASARDMGRALEDALPPLVASRVGEWVEAVAGDALERRSSTVARIESESLGRPIPAPRDQAQSESALLPSMRGTVTEPLPQLFTAMASAPQSTSEVRQPGRAWRASVTLFALTIAAMMAALGFVMRGAPVRAAATDAPAPASAPLPVPSALSTTRADPEAVLPAASASASAPAPLSATEHASTRRATARPPKTAPAKKAYTYDHL
jgi:serine/threonine-protein kinase